MVKKVILIIIAGALIFCVGYLIWMNLKIKNNAHVFMDSAKEIYIASCEGDQPCITAIQDNYASCSLENYIRDISIFTLKGKLGIYLKETHKCIEGRAQLELPSIWDYMVESSFE